MTAFLLKDRLFQNDFATMAGMTVVLQDITDGVLNIRAVGCFTGTPAEQTATRRALSQCPRPYELSFQDGTRIRGQFRIKRLNRRDEHQFNLQLVSEGEVETVQ